MKYIFTLTSLLYFSFLHAQTPTLSWIKQLGNTERESGRYIVTDISGNVYTIGNFKGTIDFDPGAGEFALTAPAVGSIFILKYDALGNFSWVKQFDIGLDFAEYAVPIAVDASSNLIFHGSFSGTFDFDPSAGTQNMTAPSSRNGFILKLDASGNFIWVRQVGGLGISVATDAFGNICTSGSFSGTADFDPSPAGTYNMKADSTYDYTYGFYRTTNGYVLKLDAAGNFVWARHIMAGMEYIKTDVAGNIYTAGDFTDTIDFNAGSGVFTMAASGDQDMFILKTDPAGNFVWAKQFGGGPGTNETLEAITTDVFGNVLAIGNFFGTVDFDPGPASFPYTAVGSDIFISKLDADGNFVWAKNVGGNPDDEFPDFVTDMQGNVYVAGVFPSTNDFDPGPSTFNLTAAGNWDIFLLKLDAAGNFIWAGSMGGINYDEVYGIGVDAANNIYTTGSFRGIADFDPNGGTSNLTSVNDSYDIFIQKLSQTSAFPVTLSHFIVQAAYCTANLKWATASGQNSSHFEVQHSTDGTAFTAIGNVSSARNSNSLKTYTFDYNVANGNSFFRLRMVDFDGSSKFSPVVKVASNCSNRLIKTYPNPAKNQVTVTGLEGANQLKLLNQLGQVLKTIKTYSSTQVINLSEVPAGQYIIQVIQNNLEVKSIKVMKE